MKKKYLVLLFLNISIHSYASVNLEENIQDFALDTKKIEIPEHPYAFNPSIIRWQGKLLMSFREIILPFTQTSNFDCSAHSQIGLVWLDENFEPISTPQIIKPNLPHGKVSKCEDSRLVVVGYKLYIVYSDCTDTIEESFRVYVAELNFEDESFSINNIECMSSFKGENKYRREKNWVPFDYQGNLLLAYSLTPHRILKPLLENGKCKTVAQTKSSISWQWGEMRGGTPGLLDENQYLAFFHSSMEMSSIHSDENNTLHYFIGAYTFSSEPPFKITHVSYEPIIAKGFYDGIKYEPYWKPVQVVFPCGFIIDDDYIWLAYGRQDHEIWILKIDKKGLFNSLVPVNCFE